MPFEAITTEEEAIQYVPANIPQEYRDAVARVSELEASAQALLTRPGASTSHLGGQDVPTSSSASAAGHEEPASIPSVKHQGMYSGASGPSQETITAKERAADALRRRLLISLALRLPA